MFLERKAVDTAVFTAWTPRANDIIIPMGVSTFALASGLEIVKTLVTTTIPEETTAVTTEVPVKKGCNSSISGVLIPTLIIISGMGIFVFRKKRI